jgi:hypothetical protein
MPFYTAVYGAFLESSLYAQLRIQACHSVGYGFAACTAGVGLSHSSIPYTYNILDLQ